MTQTPKEKAGELVDKFIGTSVVIDDDIKYYHPRAYSLSKQCALICINELIELNGELYLNGLNEDYYRVKNAELFEVKQEIEKL